MLQKLSILGKCCSFEIYSSNNLENELYTTVFNIDDDHKCFILE